MARFLSRSRHEREAERYFMASSLQLTWLAFRKHRLGLVGGGIMLIFYLVALFAEFVAPLGPLERDSKFSYAQPQRIRIVHEGRLSWPFVYGYKRSRDPESLRPIFTVDPKARHPIRLFVQSKPYKLWNLIPMKIKLFGIEEGHVFLFGSDKLGRDLFSRNIYASRVSLSIGLLGVTISFILGITLGGISGYYGGIIDLLIQRVIEFLLSVPRIPLWIALAATLPLNWPPIRVYFGITVILSLVGWGGLARVVRGKLLELREADFVMAAKTAGANDAHIIGRHLLPSFMSYLIVNLTLSIPGMILAETSLSFLGLGIRAPAVSWGTLLQDAQNVQAVANHPWLMLPALFVVLVVLCLNFVGDGLRDAADPYK